MKIGKFYAYESRYMLTFRVFCIFTKLYYVLSKSKTYNFYFTFSCLTYFMSFLLPAFKDNILGNTTGWAEKIFTLFSKIAAIFAI